MGKGRGAGCTRWRKTWPQLLSARCAVSRAPRFSIRRNTPSNSGACTSAIGRPPIHGNMSRSKRRIKREAWFGAQPGEYFENHSRATTSKLLAARSAFAEFIALRFAAGSMPAGRADEIFDAFFTTKPQGSGMGLAISRPIVESHGGRLWAASHDGRGATFHFTLPSAVVEVSAAI